MKTRRLPAAATALLLTASLVVGIDPSNASAGPALVRVTVNTRAGLAVVPDTGLGVNDAVWDSQLGTTAVSDLLKTAGVGMMRYPGGSYADIYHWRDNTAPGGYVAPGTDFDTFMASVQRVGAQPMIIANYGTGTPAEGRRLGALRQRDQGVRRQVLDDRQRAVRQRPLRFELGGRQPPRQESGRVRERGGGVLRRHESGRSHDQGGCGADHAGELARRSGAGGDAGTWNQVVLSIAGSKIDFVDLHWYPGGNTAAAALGKANQIDDSLYLVRQQIARYAGANASRIGISLTETNVGVGQNTQPAALFLADIYSGLLAGGVFTVDWWDVHNGISAVSTVAGHPDYNDFGLLSSATCLPDGTTCEPPMNTPFAPYYGLSMMKAFAHPGDQFIRAGTDQVMVSAHAVRRPNGDLAVLLVNNDPDNAYPVAIAYAGYVPAAGAPTVYSYLNGSTSVTASQAGDATSQTLPPYSLTTLVLHPASPAAAAPSAPGAPGASGITEHTATISWPAATPGVSPIAKYEVYRQNGAVSEQLGETQSTAFTVGNLVAGTRYTVNVLARDTAGNVSWASPPLTFTTGSPANSTCTVSFTDVTDWGSGYVANVDITNNGPNPIDGWTLTFSWPTSWQVMNGGWNGNWRQDGSTVTVTSLAGAGQLAAGGGATGAGFVAGYSGPNVLPSAFTLNGTLCTAT